MLFTDPKIQALFTVAHFKFSTLDPDPDRNVPTLYFEDATGVKGRIRQKHPDGQLIAYQGNCSRTFEHDDGTKSTTLAVGYHVVEENAKYGHGSKGLVQSPELNTEAIKGFDLSKFKNAPITDWTV